ncbi:spore coat protein [Effusibacillus dendaii]|uniref:Spore coat protein F-like protein YraF n=1 Tax=Effusibacillus dendaii TaxID=2743772 RepID=A0A7I8DAY0_9BACL|nr:spore coat protein [Effusibacillus dendaii]BCJ87255.1 spore coat protein F-like protein YraF [Effusibacillus dendaii]
MNNDFLDPINAKGMPELADSTIALDFLMAAKNGVRNCAIALTEIATPEVRATVRNHMEEALAMHEKISDLMISKGWFHPYNLSEQFQLDMKSADTTLKIAELKLFPDHTSRLGTFDTLEKNI